MLNKNVLIVGGAGYVGRAVLAQLTRKSGVSLVSLQRNPPKDTEAVGGVEYVKADVFDTERYKDKVQDADVIIHSMGVLLDSTVTKNAKPGDNGSYEKVNYESAKVLADLASSFENKKRKFIYLSANRAPPFLPRYIETKHRAEEYISRLDNLSFVALRPGLILDHGERPLLTPLGYLADIGNCVTKTSVFQSLRGVKYLGDALENLEVDRAVQRTDLAKAVAYLTFTDEMNGQSPLEHDEIVEAAKRYDQHLAK